MSTYPPTTAETKFPTPSNDDFTPANRAWLFSVPPPGDSYYYVGANKLTTSLQITASTPELRQWEVGPPIGANDLADFDADKYYQGPYSKTSWMWFKAQLEGLIQLGVFYEIPEAEMFQDQFGYIFDPDYRSTMPLGTKAEFAGIHQVLAQTRAGVMDSLSPPELWSRPWHEAAIETFRRGWQYSHETVYTRTRKYYSNYHSWFTVSGMLGGATYSQTARLGPWNYWLPVLPGQTFNHDLGSSGSSQCPSLVHSASVMIEFHPDYNAPLYHLTLTSMGEVQTRITKAGGLSKVLVCGLHQHSTGSINSNSFSINYRQWMDLYKHKGFVGEEPTTEHEHFFKDFFTTGVIVD